MTTTPELRVEPNVHRRPIGLGDLDLPGRAVLGVAFDRVGLAASVAASAAETARSDLGDAAGARPLLESALSITEATFGATNPSVAVRLGNLAMVLKDLGDAAGARPLLQRAVRILETRVGPDHPNTRIVRGNLDGLDD